MRTWCGWARRAAASIALWMAEAPGFRCSMARSPPPLARLPSPPPTRPSSTWEPAKRAVQRTASSAWASTASPPRNRTARWLTAPSIRPRRRPMCSPDDRCPGSWFIRRTPRPSSFRPRRAWAATPTPRPASSFPFAASIAPPTPPRRVRCSRNSRSEPRVTNRTTTWPWSRGALTTSSPPSMRPRQTEAASGAPPTPMPPIRPPWSSRGP